MNEMEGEEVEREKERNARNEKARKRERDKRIVRRKDSEHGR